MSLKCEPASIVGVAEEQIGKVPEMCSGSEEGSYLRFIDLCITQLSAGE